MGSEAPPVLPMGSYADVTRLVEEQAALRRVATLVAHGIPQEEVFAVVTEEVGRLLGAPLAGMARYGSDATATVVATWAAEGEDSGAHPKVPGPWPLEGGDLASMVWKTGRPVRIDDYHGVPGRIAAFVRDELGIGSSLASPIIVEGKLWGTLFLHSMQTDQPLPRDTESRLTGFTELVATALANADHQAALGRLAQEQAALRRVATLVARRASSEEVFETVTAEVGRVLQAEAAGIGRYEPDGTGTYVGVWSCEGGARPAPVGTPFAREPGTAATLIFETHRPGRIESYEGVPGEVAAAAREAGWQTVGAPITVEGRLWGVSVASKSREPFPADTEDRLEKFTELVATAIANAESGEALTASRARIVTAADESRRRIERNLHDGAQQRLVSLGLKLRAVAAAMQPDDALRAELAATTNDLVGVLEDLQEISRGLHPAILSDGGLKPAFKELARRSAVPVKLDVRDGRRLPEHVEVAAYYVASEALTNAVKHAQASLVEICVDCGDDSLTLSIRDDGNGGAVPNRGSGLIGLTDRVEALGGTISVVSPPGAGTSLHVRLPIA